VTNTTPEKKVCLIRLHSVDGKVRLALKDNPIHFHDMRPINENGIKKKLQNILNELNSKNGILYISFDFDFIDPKLASAVGTTITDEATMRG
jgi:arginase family enzyme